MAAAAGVSAQTVYDSVGSKRALVLQLNDLLDEEAGIVAIAMAAAAEADPAVVAGTGARIARALLENCGDIVRAVVSGAETEPELAAVRAEGLARHRMGAGMVAARLGALGALRAGLTDEAAADTIAAITDASVALLLWDQYGWSLDQVETWMADCCRTLVLA